MHRGYRAVLFYRLARSIGEKKYLGILFLPLRILNGIFNTITISIGSEIGAGLFIPHAQCIVIGYSSRIGRNVTVYQGVTLGQVPGRRKNGRSFPTIGDNAMLGAGAKILGPVTIGDNAMIGANAVVLSDIPDNAVAAGIPARVIGRVDENYPTLLKKERQHAFECQDDESESETDGFED
jgi:serine O-acetyltransferase